MFAAIALSVLAVALGAALGLVPGRSTAALGVIRTFALTAALGAVVFHLLPEAFAVLGAWSLGMLVLGMALPALVGWLAQSLGRFGQDRGRTAAGMEAAFIGLWVHHVGDGLALGTYLGDGHAAHGHHDVVLALTAHTVPVAAMVVILYEASAGRRSAFARAFWLAAAGAVGAVLSGWIPAAPSSHVTAWVSGLVAGLLIHIVTHELRAHAPQTARARSADLLAAALGVAASSLGTGGTEHGHHAGHRAGEGILRDRFLDSLVDIGLETAPVLLFGLLVAALVQTLGSRIPGAWLRPRGHVADAVRGAVVGAPLPLCSCGVLPISVALRKRGASPALVVAFLLATPELGFETFALTAQFLGWSFAAIRVGGALLAAIVAGVVIGRLCGEEPPAPSTDHHGLGGTETGPPLRRFVGALDELVRHIGAWMVVGVVAAAAVDAFVPAQFIGSLGGAWYELPVVTLLAIPSYVCAASATPIAAVLVAKGLSPGAALVALLLGPATNLATLAFLRSAFGKRALVLGVASVVAVTWTLAAGTNAWHTFARGVAHASVTDPERGTLWMVAALLLGLLFLKSVWQSGIRGWLASLSQTPSVDPDAGCGDAARSGEPLGAGHTPH